MNVISVTPAASEPELSDRSSLGVSSPKLYLSSTYSCTIGSLTPHTAATGSGPVARGGWGGGH